MKQEAVILKEKQSAEGGEQQSILEGLAAVKNILQQQKKQDKWRDKNIFGRDLNWYLRMIKWPVTIVAGGEIILYILKAFSKWRLLAAVTLELWIVFLELAFFIWLVYKIKRRERGPRKQLLMAAFFLGLSVGLIMAVFKLIWFREMWTVLNLIIEPVYRGGLGTITVFILGLFIKYKKERVIN